MNPSSAQAAVIVDELIQGGVTDVVLCPGSRSAPLAFALHAADAAGRIRLHVRVDERGAGFLALGLGRASERAAAVVTTSGTAVANLHPAVLEAHHGGVPLLVLSADRPPRLRDVGANQVIDQLRVFGDGTLRYQHDLAVAARVTGQNGYWRGQVCRALAGANGVTGGRPGPAQLNVPFDVPLVPDDDGSGYDAVLGGAVLGGAAPDDWPESLAGRGGPWTAVVGAPSVPAASAAGPAPRRTSGGGPQAASIARTAAPDPADSSSGDRGRPRADPAAGMTQAPRRSGQRVGAVPFPSPGERCLVIADLTHPWASAVAAAGVPVIGEAGGLAGERVLAAGMHLLADAEFLARHRPDRVIVLGRPTLFRAVTALLARGDIVIDVVDNPAAYADLAGTVRLVSPWFQAPRVIDDGPVAVSPQAGPAAVDDDPDAASGVARAGDGDAWAGAWRAADEAARAAIDDLLDDGVLSGPLLARTVAAALPDGATLFVGSSQSPRDLARFARPRDGVRVLANRGVAGIDGSLSTAVGIALAQGSATAGPSSLSAPAGAVSGAPHPVYALLGDLAFLHDVTALAIGPHEPRPDLTVVVANNDGGGIFAALEQGDARFGRAFERVFGTPTGTQLAQLAEAFGVEHVLATTVEEVADEVAGPPRGIRVVEVPTSRTGLREFDAAVTAAVRAALVDL